MKLIIISVAFITLQNSYQYKVININNKDEGTLYSTQKYNKSDTIILLTNKD